MLDLPVRPSRDSANTPHAAMFAQPADFDPSPCDSYEVAADAIASARGRTVELFTSAPRSTLPASSESDARGWMTRVQARDESALSQLHTAFQRRMFLCALAIVRRDEIAHEVVSLTFMQVWTTAADYDPLRGSVAAWMLLIARSRSFDELRRARVHTSREVSADEEDSGAEVPTLNAMLDPLAHLERKTRDHRLHRALLRLSPIQRQVISLTSLDGLSQDEASRHLNLPLGTVKSHARRGLTALKARCEAIGLDSH